MTGFPLIIAFAVAIIATILLMGIFFPFLLAAILNSARGSSTVAIATRVGIVAPLLNALGFTAPVDPWSS